MSDQIISPDQPAHESAWKKICLNNKGVLLILLAQVAGSSMDAIARFLQQGGRAIHPFQVCIHVAHKFILSIHMANWSISYD